MDNPGSFKEYVFAPGVPAPCVAGKQQWTGYQYPGIITKHPTGTEDYSIRGKFKVPVNLHIGNIGLVPDTNMAVNSIPPMKTGGNMDNRRIGKGATLYLPVENAGALLMMGDAHVAQGDSELDGTGAYKNARDWLMRFKGLTEDQAITLLTVAGDFAITQVVDGNWGVHVVIPKYVFSNPKAAFKPATKCGSSLPA
ncbi:acetamidase/formamidase [Monoraphidium neglectum]|uniref:Acetamidase/formamidase n=1 Tax=Monoraphidium neglectum TaxID=145388 RepID=A0A0D2LF10_9CHLO|nr:acetamidase/formamidase [Monoraphidium neglectum]KIZ05259.1 acetamidase/formamidase [Monoraphidium neglectum]|eukprot:XP_013904278.1 acetamidase/formamidase [Monoraphidium neglectum]